MLSFSPIFLFLLLSLVSLVVVAAPIATSVTQHRLKLRKLPVVRDDEHPIVAFERHYEAAIQRLHSYSKWRTQSRQRLSRLLGRLPPRQRDYLEQVAKERVRHNHIRLMRNNVTAKSVVNHTASYDWK